jgi:hypothetical protein
MRYTELIERTNTISSRRAVGLKSRPGKKDTSNYSEYISDYDSEEGLSTMSDVEHFDGGRESRLVEPGGKYDIETTDAAGKTTRKVGHMQGPQSWAYDKPKKRKVTENLTESGSIYWEDEDFDAEDPTVLIRGYGTLKYKTLQKAIAKDLAEMSNRVLDGNLEVVANHQLLDRKSAFNGKVQAYLDVTKELAKPTIKRKLTIHKRNSLFNTIKNSDQ